MDVAARNFPGFASGPARHASGGRCGGSGRPASRRCGRARRRPGGRRRGGPGGSPASGRGAGAPGARPRGR
ncbi:hypothetical protein D7X75_33200 [Corallococcus sp. CA031C]|nr:hypothetical protein D7X75_33200 [Corallococcus sp. CA031C]